MSGTRKRKPDVIDLSLSSSSEEEPEEDFSAFAQEMKQFVQKLEGYVSATKTMLTSLGEKPVEDPDSDSSDDESYKLGDMEHEKKIDEYWKKLKRERLEAKEKRKAERARRREELKNGGEAKEEEERDKVEERGHQRNERKSGIPVLKKRTSRVVTLDSDDEIPSPATVRVRKAPIDLKDIGDTIKIILLVMPNIRRIGDIFKDKCAASRDDMCQRLLLEVPGFVRGEEENSLALLEKVKSSVQRAREEFFLVEEMGISKRLTLPEQLQILRKIVTKKGGRKMKISFPSGELLTETQAFLQKKDPDWKPNKVYRRQLRIKEEQKVA